MHEENRTVLLSFQPVSDVAPGEIAGIPFAGSYSAVPKWDVGVSQIRDRYHRAHDSIHPAHPLFPRQVLSMICSVARPSYTHSPLKIRVLFFILSITFHMPFIPPNPA